VSPFSFCPFLEEVIGVNFREWKVFEGNRLYEIGSEGLSAEELLAHVLRSQTVARDLVHKFKTLGRLAEASIQELTEVSGVSRNRAEQIRSCFELARRFRQSGPNNGSRIFRSPDIVVAYLGPIMANLKKETFRTLLLNTRHQLIRCDLVSLGTLNASLVHPREVFKPAIEVSAACVILAHNHPSGDPEPSREDLLLTKRLSQAAELLGIDLLDHVIIAGTSHVSLKERKLM
jgi:DNA repair protein RadC